MKILLVEDDFDLSGALMRALTRRGMEVITSGDGLTALGLCKHHAFDAITLDLSIPGIDGLHLLQRLHVAGAGNVGAFGGGLPASHGQKLPAQRIQAITRLG